MGGGEGEEQRLGVDVCVGHRWQGGRCIVGFIYWGPGKRRESRRGYRVLVSRSRLSRSLHTHTCPVAIVAAVAAVMPLVVQY